MWSEPGDAEDPSFSSSSLLSIISGLLVSVAIELAVFLRPEVETGGVEFASLSLLEARVSQEKGLVSFRVDGGGGGSSLDVGRSFAGGGGATAAVGGIGLREGDVSAGGDQGMEGRELVMLCREMVLLGCRSFSGGIF